MTMLRGMILATMAALVSAQAPAQPSDDPYLWLEDVHGEKALAWARKESDRTLAELQSDPRYKTMYDAALKQLEAQDRIPYVHMRPSGLYNFWQDADHVRGIYRRTTMASYRTDSPKWETVLDIDALAKADGKSWVYQGMSCLPPAEVRCLVMLSEGGSDAHVVREFDLGTRSFVEGGFSLPAGKQSASWIDADTILVARDWGAGTTTPSGYPFITKKLRRGQTLDQAVEVFRGEPTDVSAGAYAMRDTDGRVQALIGYRNIEVFNNEFDLIRPGGKVKLDIPRRANLGGIIDGRVLVNLDQAWEPAGGAAFKADSIISYDLAAWKRDPNSAKPDLVWAPGERQTLSGVSGTHGKLLVNILDNVRGRAFTMDYVGGRWRKSEIALPQNSTLGVATTSLRNEQAMLTATDYLTPTTLWFYDGATGKLEKIKSSPPRFDASHHVVEQLEAVSRDGTRIPYFLIRPADMKRDGTTPTLLYGYGGFQSQEVPYYSGTLGKLWLEPGNAYVVANIRGGGEFGPEWHQAAQGAHKQRSWDDFIAVAEDIERRKISSPRRLGVVGGSQGGLLVGTAITQRPELFNAAIVQVPLFDMLRYHLIGAGASWIGEYGDPRIPEQRAWLEAYSPYQKLRAGVTYPMPFIETSTADDRVTPVHGRKAAARLAELNAPYYYYENMEGGHAAAANLPENARRLTLEYLYALRRLAD
jgi:prolyl oligopeptidase